MPNSEVWGNMTKNLESVSFAAVRLPEVELLLPEEMLFVKLTSPASTNLLLKQISEEDLFFASNLKHRHGRMGGVRVYTLSSFWNKCVHKWHGPSKSASQTSSHWTWCQWNIKEERSKSLEWWNFGWGLWVKTASGFPMLPAIFCKQKFCSSTSSLWEDPHVHVFESQALENTHLKRSIWAMKMLSAHFSWVAHVELLHESWGKACSCNAVSALSHHCIAELPQCQIQDHFSKLIQEHARFQCGLNRLSLKESSSMFTIPGGWA